MKNNFIEKIRNLIFTAVSAILILNSCNLEEDETQPLVPDFTANIAEIEKGQTVIFSDKSTGDIKSWHWEFPGGTPAVSTEQNPSVFYNDPGNYAVRLRVENGQIKETKEKPDFIHVRMQQPVAAFFLADREKVKVGQEIEFQNNSTGDQLKYEWYFEGGTPESSTQKNPRVVYAKRGIYRVALLVRNERGSTSSNMPQYVTVKRVAQAPPIIKDIDGNEYPVVIIDDLAWTAKNVNTTKYANGDQIPNGLVSGWIGLTTGAYGNYDNLSANANWLGRHYNWYAAMDPRNICPDGWHVATIEDWIDLINFFHPTEAGGKLKDMGTDNWLSPNTGASNAVGFKAIAAGVYYGNFSQDYARYAVFWGAGLTQTDSGHQFGFSHNSKEVVYPVSGSKTNGFSCRCVKNY